MSKFQIANCIHLLKTLAGTLACLAVLAGNTARADLMAYVDAVNAGTPYTFLAWDISDIPIVVDIGDLPGPDRTYEFIANGFPTASSALLGDFTDGGQHQAIKFEQWPSTGLYGVTNYGAFDYDFGVPTTFGSDVILDYVVTGGTTSLFVNGVDTGATVPFEMTLQGNVGLGGAPRSDGSFIDIFDGTILAAATFNSALSPDEIMMHSDAFFAP
jgi:hypothetical protein